MLLPNGRKLTALMERLGMEEPQAYHHLDQQRRAERLRNKRTRRKSGRRAAI